MNKSVRNVRGLRIVAKRALNDVLPNEEMRVAMMRKSVAASGLRVVREGTTGRVLEFVPRKAFEKVVAPVMKPQMVSRIQAVGEPVMEDPKPEVAFYRKYTEAMLRRYLKMSMEAGRVPSLLGKEMFRGNVTSYRVRSFEDVVIFCYDVERCLKVLTAREGELVKRIAMQHYTKQEAASALGISLRWCVLMYAAALDKLTQEMLERDLLNPLQACQ